MRILKNVEWMLRPDASERMTQTSKGQGNSESSSSCPGSYTTLVKQRLLALPEIDVS